MLLRGDIAVEDHATLEQFMHDIHNLRLFSLPPQTLEVKSHTNIPSTGTMREAVAWKKLTKIRERFKQISLELDTAMMDLGLDVPKSYEPSPIKVGVQKLTEFYQEW